MDTEIVNIERFAYTPNGTFSYIKVSKLSDFLYGIERPWFSNLTDVSCIPCGAYIARLTTYTNSSGREYPAYEIMNVKDRTRIKMHVANTIHGIKGCIGFGMRLGYLRGVWGVLDSVKAYTAFMEAVEWKRELIINISNYIGGLL